MYIYIYIHAYIQIHMHAYIYIHTYIWGCVSSLRVLASAPSRRPDEETTQSRRLRRLNGGGV